MTGLPRHALWVRMPRFIGDGILISQSLEPLRRAQIPLVAWGPERVLDLYRGSSAFSGVHADEPAGRQVLALARALRRHEAMGVLGLTRSLRPLLAGWVARVPLRIGWSDKGGRYLGTHTAPFWQVDLHHFDRYQALVRSAFPDLPEGGPHAFHPRPEAEAAAFGLLAQIQPGETGFVACALGAHGWNKRLSTTIWTALAGRLLESGMVPVLLGSGPEDAEQAHTIQAAHPGVRNLVGSVGLADTAGLLCHARGLVGNDSALAHLAAAVECPCVVAFGPTRPSWTAPRGPAVSIVRREDLPCLACGSHGCPTPGHPCMQALPAERLLEALGGILLPPSPVEAQDRP